MVRWLALGLALAGCTLESDIEIEADELRDQANRATEAIRFEGGESVVADQLAADGPEVASFYSPLRYEVGVPFTLQITPVGQVAEVAAVTFTLDHATSGYRMPATVEDGAVVVRGEITSGDDFDRAVRLAGIALVDAEGRKGRASPMPVELRGSETPQPVGSRLRTLQSVTPQVMATAFPPVGPADFMITGGGNGVLVRWQLGDSARAVRRFEGHEGLVRVARVTRDRTRVASAGEDHTVRVWDAVSGEQVALFTEHEDFVTALAFSGPGDVLVSGGWDGLVRARRVDDGVMVGETRLDTRVNSVALSPDGLHFVVASGRPLHPGTVTLVNLVTRERKAWTGFDREATQVVFDPTGAHFAVGFGRGAVRVFETRPDAEPLELPAAASDVVQGLAFPEGRVVAATLNGVVAGWDAKTGEQLGVDDTNEVLLSVALSGDLDVLALGNVEGVVRMIDFTPFRDSFDRPRPARPGR